MLSRSAKLTLLIGTLSALLLSALPAEAWDNTYGVRDDASSFSSAESVVVDDAGNLYIGGWFWGDFEGLSSPEAYQPYVMRVLAGGSVDWTIPAGEAVTTGPPNSDVEMHAGSVMVHGSGWVTPEGTWTDSGPDCGARSSIDRSLRLTWGPKKLDVADCVGNDLFSFEPFQAIMDEYSPPGLTDWDIKDVKAIGGQVYVLVTFKTTVPDSNKEAGVWRLALDGSTVWATGLIGRDTPIPQYYGLYLQESRVVAPIDPLMEGGSHYSFSRSNGSAQLVKGQGSRFEGSGVVCETSDPTVLAVRHFDYDGACLAGQTELGRLRAWDWQVVDWLEAPDGELYLWNASSAWAGAVMRAREHVSGVGFQPEVIDARFPVLKASDPTNRTNDITMGATGLVFAGRMDRSAAFGSVNRMDASRVTLIEGTSGLFSAAVGTKVLTGVPGVPLRPRSVVATRSGDRVKVNWRAPKRLRGSVVTDYVVVYRNATRWGRSRWEVARDGRSTDTVATVAGLDQRSSGRYDDYQVRVLAKNRYVLSEPSGKANVPRS